MISCFRGMSSRTVAFIVLCVCCTLAVREKMCCNLCDYYVVFCWFPRPSCSPLPAKEEGVPVSVHERKTRTKVPAVRVQRSVIWCVCMLLGLLGWAMHTKRSTRCLASSNITSAFASHAREPAWCRPCRTLFSCFSGLASLPVR